MNNELEKTWLRDQYTGPGGGLYTGPGGGMYTGPGGGAYTGSGGGMYTGPSENPYRNNQPPKKVLVEYLRENGMVELADHIESFLN